MKELIVASNPSRRSSAKQRAAARRNIKKAQAALRRRNPRKRRRSSSSASSPRRRRRRRRGYTLRRISRRRNPSVRGLKSLGRGLIDRQVMPALIGGAGAVVNDVAYGFLPLPTMLKEGPFRHVGKAAAAVLLGYVAGMVLGRRLGDQLGAGALTVVGYNVVKEAVTKVAPTLNLGMYLEPGLGYPGAGWSPRWGGINNTMSGVRGMRALLPRTTSAGGPGVPDSGVQVPRQLTQPSMYAAQRSMYADQLDAAG